MPSKDEPRSYRARNHREGRKPNAVQHCWVRGRRFGGHSPEKIPNQYRHNHEHRKGEEEDDASAHDWIVASG